MSPTAVEEEVPAATSAAQVLALRTLLLGAALALLVAIVIWVGVIPQVLRDTFSAATPERAAAAFRVSALLHVLAGIAALAVSRVPSPGAFLRRALLPGSAGVLVILLGLVLIDAALAFPAHGPALRGVVVLLWACVALDLIGGLSLLVSAVTARR